MFHHNLLFWIKNTMLLLCSLVKRKEEWQRAEEERISSLPDPSVPSGHKVMPDKERRETLNALQEGIDCDCDLLIKTN